MFFDEPNIMLWILNSRPTQVYVNKCQLILVRFEKNLVLATVKAVLITIRKVKSNRHEYLWYYHQIFEICKGNLKFANR